ncbi:MAG: HPr family phosphocarrier protein [Nanoarchaeota archaeon]
MSEKPEISYERGYVVARDIPVNLERGIVSAPACYITLECRKYKNEILFSSKGNVVSGKSIMGLMTLEAEKGSRLNVLVQNLPGTNPKRIAERLYSGITSMSENPDFDRNPD